MTARLKTGCQDADVPPVDPISRDLTEALLSVLRRRLGEQTLSGQQLADRTGIAQSTVSRKLRGVGDFTVDELDAVALALGVNRAEELLEEARTQM